VHQFGHQTRLIFRIFSVIILYFLSTSVYFHLRISYCNKSSIFEVCYGCRHPLGCFVTFVNMTFPRILRTAESFFSSYLTVTKLLIVPHTFISPSRRPQLVPYPHAIFLIHSNINFPIYCHGFPSV